MHTVPRRILCSMICLALVGSAANAAVSVTDGRALKMQQKGIHGAGIHTAATGSQSLIDGGGLKYFINTNITFSTTSSASGAMSEASYTHAVLADTSAGGQASSTLNDAFDGFNTACLSLNNTVANCQTGNANFVIYNKTGAAATLDASCSNRQIIFPVMTSGNLSLQRKVYVPANDTFARHLNVVTNNGGTAQTVTLVISNNLGSDSNTTITATSAGGAAPTSVTDTATTWLASFQNWSGSTSSDVRLGFALRSTAGSVPLAGINFANGDDNPFWGYTFTVQPGQTMTIANFVTGQPTRAAAASKAAELAGSANANQWACMSPTEMAAVSNFAATQLIPAGVPALNFGGLAGLAALLMAVAGFTSYKRRQQDES